MNVIAIVPYKGSIKSKSRLSNILPSNIRIQLSKAMLMDVLNALIHSNKINKVILVTPDSRITKEIGEIEKVKLVIDYGKGQIKAVKEAIKIIKSMEVDALMYCVADMPLVKSENFNEIIRLISGRNTIVLSPSIDGGTNIILEYPPNLINLRYGPNSFIKHIYEAVKRNLNIKLYATMETIIDVDTIDDLILISSLCKSGCTYNVIRTIKGILDEYMYSRVL